MILYPHPGLLSTREDLFGDFYRLFGLLLALLPIWSFACTSIKPSGLFALLDLPSFDLSISLRDFYRKVFSCNLYRVGVSSQRGKTRIVSVCVCIPALSPRVHRVHPPTPTNPFKS